MIAQGISRHHFWGTYYASVGLRFASEEAAEAALRALSRAPAGELWKVGEKSAAVLVWFGDSEALSRLEAGLREGFALRIVPCGRPSCRSQCKDQTIGGVPHSVDVGPAFEITVPALVVAREQLALPGVPS